MAGEEKEAVDVLDQLTENALRESRFQDASCYYRIKATQLLDYYIANNKLSKKIKFNNSENLIERWTYFTELADIYFAYDSVFKYAVIYSFIIFFTKYLFVFFNCLNCIYK